MPEIRDPLYGMVTVTPLEWAIIQSAPFQRLRRIKQLAFSDYVYPGAVHTRFEHSIGVMRLASDAFDRITSKPEALNALGYDEAFKHCARCVVRLAALIHDLGHLPFSHAAEGILPIKSGDVRFRHEDYTDALVRMFLPSILDNSVDNSAYQLTANDIADFLMNRIRTPRLARLAPWRGLITGQLDADRMDYLRRDSHHLGVKYGLFDTERVLSTLTFVQSASTGEPLLAIEEGGLLAAESLILARYYMFNQVYYHKVRRYLDHLYEGACESLQLEGKLVVGPPVSREDLARYTLFDDWAMQSMLNESALAGNACALDLIHRRSMKVLFEIEGADKTELMQEAESQLVKKGVSYWRDSGSVSATQKFNTANLMVVGESSFQGVAPISNKSRIAMAVPFRIYIERLYVSADDRKKLKVEAWFAKLMKKGEKVDERRKRQIAAS